MARNSSNNEADIIFGPVPSRRLGMSLGVDIIPMKVCSYDCIYCELGKTTLKSTQRKEYIPSAEVKAALENYFNTQDTSNLDYVTFSGSGEPTLHINIRSFIATLKDLTSKPIAVLTNGSLFFDPGVRTDLMNADLVIPSLDAVSPEVFRKINQPASGLDVGRIIKGIEEFTKAFRGEVWLEILFVKGVNDGHSEIEKLADAAGSISPAKVQINTVARPPGVGKAEPLSADSLHEIAAKFAGNVEVITDFSRKDNQAYENSREDEIIAMLRIRPMTLEDLSASLAMHRAQVLKYIGQLRQDHKVNQTEFHGKRYFTIIL